MGRRKRRRVDPTRGWGQLGLPCRWPKRVAYEGIRPPVIGRSRALAQPGLFAAGTPGDVGWPKAPRLEDHTARRVRPEASRRVLFPYQEAWG